MGTLYLMLMGKSYTMLLSQIPELDEGMSDAQHPRPLLQSVRAASPRKEGRGRCATGASRPLRTVLSLPGERRRREQCL
jgi:hypothetical protein